MSQYRVTIPVEFVVEIDENNETVDGPPALQGDAPLTAARRALWVLFRQDVAHFNADTFDLLHAARRPLGVKQMIVRGHERDLSVEMVPPGKM